MKNGVVNACLVIGLIFFLEVIGVKIFELVKSEEHMKHITVTNRDHDTELHLQVGDELTVRLEAIPGTGYSWNISEGDEGMLSLIGDPVFERSGVQVLGGVEQQIFRFRATSPGTRRLEFEYRRPWDKVKTATKSYSIKLLIDE